MTSNNQRPSYPTFKLLTVVLLLYFMPACSSDTSSSDTCTINYWVATNGSDQASGDSDNPFLTLEHARDVIRANSDRGTCTINVNIKRGHLSAQRSTDVKCRRLRGSRCGGGLSG